MQFKTSSSQLQLLAIKWQMIGMALIAIAREVSLAYKQRAHSGIAKADYLEAVLFAALVSLSGKIAEQVVAEQNRSASDEEALQYLRTVHALLSVTVLLIQQIRRDLALICERWLVLLRGPALFHQRNLTCFPINTGYLDSS